MPVACFGCDRPLTHRAAPLLCDQCRLELRLVDPPQCRRCGHTLDRWHPKTGRPMRRKNPPPRPGEPPGALPRCNFCLEWPSALAWAASAVWFDEGPARRIVHALKYGGWTIAADPMAAVIQRELSEPLADADVLIPVPLAPKRQSERGYNQAAYLAAALGIRIGRSWADVLVRVRETRTQTELTPAERRANVAGAFLARELPYGVRGHRVVLLDDVLTTGATLGAAAEALMAAGAAEVGALTFARAVKPE